MQTMIQQPPVATLLLALFMLFGITQPATAVTQDSPSDTSKAVPQRGMTMTQVEQRYGLPATRHTTVGEPPITRWDYDGFVVYFERHRLLHAFTPKPAKN